MGIAHESMSRGALPAPERPSGLPDRYRVLRHIANGGMASVWCAEDVLLGRSVAVKILAERFAHDQFAVRRFKREARAAARVSNHTHVVTVYDVGDLVPEPGVHPAHPEGRAFIVMEYLAGGTVADAIHHDSVRRHEAMRWLREAASALDHAHERGIVHRDIKPANFLLDRARVLHVADFGIARLTTEDTITTSDQLFGTAAYLSPEQALGKEATGASDRYALAVAAFELLAGQRPFSAPHFSAQARQHIEEPPPAASELDHTLPRAVDEVLFAGLAKDAAARPESAGAFVAALQDALAGGSGAIHREPRHRAPAAVADAGRDRAPARPDPGAPVASTAAARRRTAGGTRPPVSRAPGPPPRERARRRRIVALASIAATVLVIVGIAVAATRGGGAHNDGSRVAARTKSAVSHRTHTHARAARHHAAPHPKTTTTTATTSSTPTTTAETSPEELESTGHQEMLAGDYSSAIPTLRQAVAAAPPDDPNHAYALYDLGRSLVLSGDPEDAIPILRQRLEIPNQQATVQAMLDTALADAGQATPTGSGGAAPTSSTPTPPTQPPGATGSPTQPGPPPPPTGSGGAGLPGANDPGGDDHGSDGGGDSHSTPRLRSSHRHHGGSILHFITAAAG
jgi:tRNA A-37 threonylcarbamoyl transferase component Bud32/tetratricopeptide (TPR) repeat protein